MCSCLLTRLLLSHVRSIPRQVSERVTHALIEVEVKLDKETAMNIKKGIQGMW